MIKYAVVEADGAIKGVVFASTIEGARQNCPHGAALYQLPERIGQFDNTKLSVDLATSRIISSDPDSTDPLVGVAVTLVE